MASSTTSLEMGLVIRLNSIAFGALLTNPLLIITMFPPEMLLDSDEKGAPVQKLIDIVNEISTISDYRCTVKKQYCNLARRLKLLTPMFEEIRDCKEPVPEESFKALESLKEALKSARDLLRIGSEGSRIYLVLERDQIMKRFQEVTACLEQALGGISYEKLDISDEVKEQVDLVLGQFRRAKGRVDSPDVELHENLLSLYNNDASEGPAVIRRVAEKLQLMEISDLTQESIVLHEMVSASGGDPGEGMEKMSMLLKKIKEIWVCPAGGQGEVAARR
ncbi:hypothetical protein CsSME_00053745 [Camellia sinensis var. sinensis]